MSEPAAFVPAYLLGGTASGGFRADLRFSGEAPPPSPAPVPDAPGHDPIAMAWSEGFATGLEQAANEAAAQAEAENAARAKLVLSFARIDAMLEEKLRTRLRETVAALCEGALAPLALDEAALLHRVEKAASMLARADDHRIIRLHPEDLDFISAQLSADWQVLPDPSLERGSVRVEGESGGVEDGPEQWREQIAEALRQC